MIFYIVPFFSFLVDWIRWPLKVFSVRRTLNLLDLILNSIFYKFMPFLTLRTLVIKDPKLNFIFCIFGILTGTEEVYSTCGTQESYSRSLSRVLSVWDDTEIHVWGKCLEELGSVEKCQGRTGGSEVWR